MNFQDYARRETGSALEALSNDASAAVREEIDALRAALDARMTALEGALARGDHQALAERLAEDLSRAAAEQIEELVARARYETQEAADARLTEVQAQPRSELEWARGEKVALSASLDEARQQLGALEEASRSSAEARGDL